MRTARVEAPSDPLPLGSIWLEEEEEGGPVVAAWNLVGIDEKGYRWKSIPPPPAPLPPARRDY